MGDINYFRRVSSPQFLPQLVNVQHACAALIVSVGYEVTGRGGRGRYVQPPVHHGQGHAVHVQRLDLDALRQQQAETLTAVHARCRARIALSVVHYADKAGHAPLGGGDFIGPVEGRVVDFPCRTQLVGIVGVDGAVYLYGLYLRFAPHPLRVQCVLQPRHVRYGVRVRGWSERRGLAADVGPCPLGREVRYLRLGDIRDMRHVYDLRGVNCPKFLPQTGDIKSSRTSTSLLVTERDEITIRGDGRGHVQSAVHHGERYAAYLDAVNKGLDPGYILIARNGHVLCQFFLHPVLIGLLAKGGIHLRGERIVIENLYQLVLKHHRAGYVRHVDDLRHILRFQFLP